MAKEPNKPTNDNSRHGGAIDRLRRAVRKLDDVTQEQSGELRHLRETFARLGEAVEELEEHAQEADANLRNISSKLKDNAGPGTD